MKSKILTFITLVFAPSLFASPPEIANEILTDLEANEIHTLISHFERLDETTTLPDVETSEPSVPTFLRHYLEINHAGRIEKGAFGTSRKLTKRGLIESYGSEQELKSTLDRAEKVLMAEPIENTSVKIVPSKFIRSSSTEKVKLLYAAFVSATATPAVDSFKRKALIAFLIRDNLAKRLEGIPEEKNTVNKTPQDFETSKVELALNIAKNEFLENFAAVIEEKEVKGNRVNPRQNVEEKDGQDRMKKYDQLIADYEQIFAEYKAMVQSLDSHQGTELVSNGSAESAVQALEELRVGSVDNVDCDLVNIMTYTGWSPENRRVVLDYLLNQDKLEEPEKSVHDSHLNSEHRVLFIIKEVQNSETIKINSSNLYMESESARSSRVMEMFESNPKLLEVIKNLRGYDK